MRNKQQLVKEIVELCAIKASYNNYLASAKAAIEVENATQVHLNLKTISATLRALYAELKDLNHKRPEDERHEIRDVKQESSKQANYLQNMRAIMLFNTDTRFSITE